MIPRAILGMPRSALFVGSTAWYLINVALPRVRERIVVMLEDDLINGTPTGSEHFKVPGVDG